MEFMRSKRVPTETEFEQRTASRYMIAASWSDPGWRLAWRRHDARVRCVGLASLSMTQPLAQRPKVAVTAIEDP